MASIGDFNNDGIVDIAVGALGDDDSEDDDVSNTGALWLLFLNSNGTVKGHQKISAEEGGFTGMLAAHD